MRRLPEERPNGCEGFRGSEWLHERPSAKPGARTKHEQLIHYLPITYDNPRIQHHRWMEYPASVQPR